MSRLNLEELQRTIGGSSVPRLARVARVTPIWLIGATAVCLLVIYIWQIRSYFFVFDDFVLVALSSLGLREMALQSVAGVYRPLGFALLKLESAGFGWSLPAGYITVTLAFHLASVLLVSGIVRRCGRDWQTASVASVCFLSSPWAVEGHLWLAGRFDVMAGCALLASLWLGLRAVTAPTTGASMITGLAGVLSGAAAVLSKEIGVVIPGLFALAAAFVVRPRGLPGVRSATYLASLIVTVVGYLYVREQTLPGLAGPYGSIGELFAKASLTRNMWAYIRALAVPLLPAFDGGVWGWLLTPIVYLHVGAVGFLVWNAVRESGRLVVFAALAFLLSLAPVLWVQLIPGISTNGRFLYFPGVWCVFVFALGARRLWRNAQAHPSAWTVTAGIAPLAIMLALSLVSIWSQALIWRQAFMLSRLTLDEMRPHAASAQPVFIQNLPSRYVEGPYVLREDSFRFFFPAPVPAIRGKAMALTYRGSESVFAGWLPGNSTGDPVPAAGEKVVQLNLPIRFREPEPVSLLESPPNGASVIQPFTVRGWAVDAAALRGSGVDIVHVYAYPQSGQAIFLGGAEYGWPRPDVARAFGRNFANSEFRLSVHNLPAGAYVLAVHPHDTVLGTFAPALVTSVTIR